MDIERRVVRGGQRGFARIGGREDARDQRASRIGNPHCYGDAGDACLVIYLEFDRLNGMKISSTNSLLVLSV